MSNKQNITSRDYDGFLHDLAIAAKTDPTFKDYNFDGSGLRSLMRILALAGNQQAFADNMLFNELSIKHAEMRENVGAMAAFLAYTPMSSKGATMIVDITVRVPPGTISPPSSLTLEPDNTFVGSKDGISYQFSPTQSKTVNLANNAYTFTDVVLTQGRWVYNSFETSAAGENTVETHILPNKDIDITTLSVYVQASSTSTSFEEYTKYSSAYQLGPEAKVYFLELNKDGHYTIEFGDNKVAKQVVSPNVILTRAMVTRGASGNEIGSILPTSSIGQFSTIEISVKSRSANGADPESVRSISRNAPIAFGTDGVAVTANDYPSVLRGLFPTAKITSWGGEENVPAMQGYTVIAVKPQGKAALSAAEKTQGETYLNGRNVGSIFAKIIDADIYYINVESKVYWYPTKTTLDSDGVKSLVQKAIKEYSSESLENFQVEFDPKFLSDKIRKNVMVKRDVTSVTYEKHHTVAANTVYTGDIDFHKKIAKGSVAINGFKYNLFDGIIKDVDGVLKLYTTNLREETFIADVGSVDYTTGVISLRKLDLKMTTAQTLMAKVKPDDLDVSVASKRGEFIQVKDVLITPEVAV